MDWSDILCFGFLAALVLIFVHKWVGMLLDFWSFSRWHEIEATLEDLKIEKVGRNGPLARANRNVKVRFSYRYGNAQFQGDSVAIPDLVPFPIIQYAPGTYQPLDEVYRTTKRMRGWADPDRPDRAVLRDVSPGPYLLGGVAMVICFAGIGYYLGITALPTADLPKIGGTALVIYLAVLYWSYRFKRFS